MRAVATLLSAVTLAAVVAAPTAASATTTTPRQLPITSLGDLVVDSAHGHVYLTAATGNGGVYVRNLAGDAVSTVFANEGARGMALSADGATLYVALVTSHALVALDTTTLAETGRWATGASTCPTDVGEVATRLWFTYGCTGFGNLGVVERAGETPEVTLARSPVTLGLQTSTFEVTGDKLVVDAQYSDTMYVLTADGTTLTTSAEREYGDGVVDYALTPDGTGVLVAAFNTEPRLGAHALTDLATVQPYAAAVTYPSAIAGTTGFVATANSNWWEKEIDVWTAAGARVRSYDLAACCNDTSVTPQVVRRGVEFSADGATLYVLTQSGSTTAPLYLHALSDPTKAVSTITLTKPSSAKIRTAYTVKGKLSSALAIPAGRTVKITRSSTYGTAALPSVTTASDGTFSFTDTVRKRATYTYKASWAGDAQHAPALGQASFKVLGLTPSLSIATNASTYRYGATGVATAKLGTTYSSRVVQITATPYGYSKRVLKTANVDGNGYLKGSATLSRRTTFAATFPGDEVYEPRTVTKVVTVGAKLRQTMSGYYALSGSYRVYRSTVHPIVDVLVAPNRAGTCMAFTAQAYTSGAWRTVASESCLRLDYYSQQSAILTGTHATGVNMRIRSTFMGDVSNTRTTGAWMYFRFTR